MEELIKQFDKGEVNAEEIYNYFYWVRQTIAYAKTCCSRAMSLDDRLKQIAVQVPAFATLRSAYIGMTNHCCY